MEEKKARLFIINAKNTIEQKRFTHFYINDVFLSPINENPVEEQLDSLSNTMNSMCIAPIRDRDENRIYGIRP